MAKKKKKKKKKNKNNRSNIVTNYIKTFKMLHFREKILKKKKKKDCRQGSEERKGEKSTEHKTLKNNDGLH